MTEPEDNPYAPPPPGWQPPAAPPPPYAAPPGWQPGPPPPPPYAAPPGWQPPPPPPPPYGAAPGGYPPYGYQPYGYPAPSSTNGFAIAALVCSILLGVVPFLGGLLGVIFGVIGLRHCARSAERGRGLAIAGIVIGGLAIAFWALAVGVSLAHHSDTTGTGLGAFIY